MIAASYLTSPLFRHPGLLWRKIKARLLTETDPGFRYPGTVPSYVPLVQVGNSVREVASGLERLQDHEPHHNKLFRRSFPIDELRRFCVEGPDRTQSDLRGDIKLPWEFSRFYAFSLMALDTDDAEQTADELAEFYTDWWSYNGDSAVTNWSCAMEVAIRAVNLLVADALLEGRLSSAFGAVEWADKLWLHGARIWDTLEAKLKYPSNHYLSDLLGLHFIGAAFPADNQARKWKAFSGREMQRAILAQSYTDGGVYEASLPYHGLVTEMGLLFCLNSKNLSDNFKYRVRKMCQVVADHRAGNWELFCVGDDDSGRILDLDRAYLEGRAGILLKLGQHVFKEEFRASANALFPQSGWATCRKEQVTVQMVNGSVGMHGLGSHAHADDLSVIVEIDSTPILVDSGSGFYTSNPAVRNRLRKAGAHNTMGLVDSLYVMPDRTADDLFRMFEKTPCHRSLKSESSMLKGMVTNQDGITITRLVSIIDNGIAVTDHVEGGEAESFFNFSPDLEVEVIGNRFRICSKTSECFELICNGDTKLSLTDGLVSLVYGSVVENRRGVVSWASHSSEMEWQLVRMA